MNMADWRTIAVLQLLFACSVLAHNSYFGKKIGSFPSTAVHDVKGTVYAPTDDTIYITGLHYDGAGPDAYFWAGSTPRPNQDGMIIPDELGRVVKLSPYKNQNVLLKLPDGKKLRDFKWIAIWCRKFAVNFGHVDIPFDLDPPKELNLGKIPTLAHATSADAVIIKDIKTLELKRLRYDGSAPDAFFLVGKGSEPHRFGVKVPDENGSLRKIHGYTGQDITLRLPDNMTVFDIDWLGLYCITYKQNFGHVKIPDRRSLNVPADLQSLASTVEPFMNCETIFDDLMQVSWEVRTPDIYIQLEGKVDPDNYLAFGMSGDASRAKMVGADVTLVFYNSETRKAEVVDYLLTAKSQCAPQSSSGACPDQYIPGGQQNSELISSHYADGVLKATYKRALNTGDDNADQIIYTESPVTIVGAIGPLNSKKEAAYHTIRVTRASEPAIRISFNRPLVQRNCRPFHDSPMKDLIKQERSWPQEVLREETVFVAEIGPAGGDKGYTAITGIQSWGIAWWINKLLIPELHVKRGVEYTFIVSGGNDPARQAQYHPLYITNNKEGGGGQDPSVLNTRDHMVYAGVRFHGNTADPSPGAGRYCELKHKTVDVADKVRSLAEYLTTLEEQCEPGSAATFKWTPDENTPDLVYYQCYTHRNLGWKIYVSRSHLATPSLLLVLFIGLISKAFYQM